YISPSILTPTAVANTPHSNWHIVLARKASLLAACSCLMVTTRTPSSCKAVIENSSNFSWKLLCHEVPGALPADRRQRTESDSCRRENHRPLRQLDQSLPRP